MSKGGIDTSCVSSDLHSPIGKPIFMMQNFSEISVLKSGGLPFIVPSVADIHQLVNRLPGLKNFRGKSKN